MLYILPLRNTVQHELKIYLDTERPIWELGFINTLIVGKAASTSISCMTLITGYISSSTQRRSGILIELHILLQKAKLYLLGGLGILTNMMVEFILLYNFSFCRKAFSTIVSGSAYLRNRERGTIRK